MNQNEPPYPDYIFGGINYPPQKVRGIIANMLWVSIIFLFINPTPPLLQASPSLAGFAPARIMPSKKSLPATPWTTGKAPIILSTKRQIFSGIPSPGPGNATGKPVFPPCKTGKSCAIAFMALCQTVKKIYADNQATSVKKPRNMLFGQTRTPPLRRNGPKPRVFIKSLWTGSTVAIISPGCKPKTFMAYLVATYGGITEKLDTIHDLGFNTLWLTPIFKTPPSSHGYDTTDYETIDPALAQKMT